jgi:hypothetical protein
MIRKHCIWGAWLGAVANIALSQSNTFPSSGNVGVGTTSPPTKLSVVGQIRIDSAGFARLEHSTSGAMQWSVGTRDTNDYWIYRETGFSNVLIPSGNVGIGTSSPGSGLTLSREGSDYTNGSYLLVNSTNSLFGGGATLAGIQTTAADGGWYNFLKLQNAGGTKFVINGAGNVGIGTAAPAVTLDVVGSIRSQGPGFQVWGSGQLQLQYNNGGDPSDQRFTELIAQNGQFIGRFVNDAYSQADAWLIAKRNPSTYTVNSVVFPSGNVGIGTFTPGHKLSVNGTVRAKEVIVEMTGWSDYVFADDYKVTPLSEIERHIQQHKRLPGIPSAAQVAEEGVGIGEMQARLLAQVEELTLRMIAQEKERRGEMDKVLARLRQLEAENQALRTSSVQPSRVTEPVYLSNEI